MDSNPPSPDPEPTKPKRKVWVPPFGWRKPIINGVDWSVPLWLFPPQRGRPNLTYRNRHRTKLCKIIGVRRGPKGRVMGYMPHVKRRNAAVKEANIRNRARRKLPVDHEIRANAAEVLAAVMGYTVEEFERELNRCTPEKAFEAIIAAIQLSCKPKGSRVRISDYDIAQYSEALSRGLKKT